MYEEFYNLSGSPFRLNPDPSFFFASAGHRRALAYLRYGLNRREGFIVVTGNPGTGKTTLARALLADAAEDQIVVSQLNTTQLEADDVLRMVCASFGLEHENVPKATLLKRLETFFMGRMRAGEHVLLLIDEAQNLPPSSLEELRMLSNFQMGNRALVQIFMLGQQQFKDMLNAPELEQLRQRVTAACHLSPLGAVETRAYIEHRLGHVGWAGDPEITEKAYAQIFAFTQGIPRRINSFCDRLFLFGSLEELHRIDADAVETVHEELRHEIAFEQDPVPDNVPAPLPAQKTRLEEKAETPPRDNDVPPIQPLKTPVKPIDASSRQGPQGTRPVLSMRPGGGKGPGMAVGDAKIAAPPLLESDLTPFTELVALALDFYRAPKRHRHIVSIDWPLPKGIDELLELAVGRVQLPAALDNGEKLNSNLQEIRLAARNFIKRVLMAADGDHYRVLGLRREATSEQITDHYQLLFRLFQPDGAKGGEWDREHATRINQAYNVLRDAARRADYDRVLGRAEAAPKAREEISETINPHAEQTSPVGEKANAAASGPAAGGKGRGVMIGAAIAVVVLAAAAYAYFQTSLFNGYDRAARQVGSIDQSVERSERFRSPEPTEVITPVPNRGPAINEGVQAPLRGDGTAMNGDSAGMEEQSGTEGGHIRRQADNAPTAQFAIEEPPRIATVSEPDSRGVRANAPEKKKQAAPERQVETPRVVAAPPTTPHSSKTTPSKITKPSVETKNPVAAAKPVVTPEPEKAQPPVAERPGRQARLDASNVNKASSNGQAAKPVKDSAPVDDLLTPAGAAAAAAAAAPAASVAVPSLAPAKKPAVTPRSGLTDAQLDKVLNQFVAAYEGGDLGRFMALFSETAYTNDQVDVNGIRRDYEDLFKSTDLRRMEVDAFRWHRDGKVAQGEGQFRVSVRRTGDQKMNKVFAGTIILQVQENGTGPLITGLFHTYKNTDRQ